ncbi:hypothetical protein M0805_007593 [Coniferiporia weirii]|nr:hypothetical protein M0805_007593 [Coniferiporia weirii]
MSKQTIFLTGATGYIGGTVLWRLLHHEDASKFVLKVLVRSEEKAKLLTTLFGVVVVVGSHADEDKLESLTDEADYIFAIADIDDPVAAHVILRGMKKHKERTGKVSYLIHTSGTGVLSEDVKGMHAEGRVYDDSKVEDIESLPITQVHRPAEVVVTQADIGGKHLDSTGYARTYVVVPAIVYAMAKTGLTEAGIQNPHSIPAYQLVRAGLGRGQGGVVGLGKNVWPNVHIDDLADLYIILFNKIRADPEGTPHGREGYYFGASDSHVMGDICNEVAKALFALGKGKSPEATIFTQEDIDKYYKGFQYLGTNCRCIPSRSRSIGWAPTHTTSDFINSIHAEVEALIKLDARE